MGRQLFRTSLKHRLVGSGTDEVIGVMPIPKGGMLTNVWGDVHLVATSNVDRDIAAYYSCQGFIVPFLDDDDQLSVDTLWDREIPKDVDLSATPGVVDVDVTPETADATPVEEPGEVNFNRVFNIGNTAQRIYNRDRLLTVASRGLMEPVVSSQSDLWMPTDHFRIRDSKRYRVDATSYVMFAISNPNMDDMTTANEVTLSNEEQVMYENIELAMGLALPEIMGMTVTGAQSPFSDLAAMIELMVEPTTEEETAGAFGTHGFNVFTRFTYEVQFGAEGLKGPIAG